MSEPSIAVLIDIAHGLVAQPCFDTAIVLDLMGKLPLDKFDVQVCGAIRHAKITAEAARSGGVSRTVEARFALARVVTLLEAVVPQG